MKNYTDRELLLRILKQLEGLESRLEHIENKVDELDDIGDTLDDLKSQWDYEVDRAEAELAEISDGDDVTTTFEFYGGELLSRERRAELARLVEEEMQRDASMSVEPAKQPVRHYQPTRLPALERPHGMVTSERKYKRNRLSVCARFAGWRARVGV